jgi:hypothetical protein
MTTIEQAHAEISYADTHQDGLLDIFIGLCVLLAGVYILTELVYMAGIIPALFLPIWGPARKKTLQRLGLREMPNSQKSKTRLMLLFTLFLGLLTLSAGLGLYLVLSIDSLPPQWVGWIGEHFLFGLGVLGAAMLVFSGWMTGIRRLYVYAALLLSFLVVGAALGIEVPLALIALGVVILVCGLFIYWSFIRRYPAGQMVL